MSVTGPRGGGSLGSKPLEFWGGNVRAENSLFQRLGFLTSSVIGFRRLLALKTLCKVSALWFLGVALRWIWATCISRGLCRAVYLFGKKVAALPLVMEWACCRAVI